MKQRPSIDYKKNDWLNTTANQVFRQPPDEGEVSAWACKVLQALNGLTHAEIRHVLRQADVLLSNATVLDCSSNEIQKVFREYIRDSNP
ncbi:hypothetical protein ACIPF8_10795 [Collimonas sp. NPDC087041]|uniref:hypothetical protein n=1 Tax=Collimonas sp. NPDC087041 TaxID=3363960 RepID=UPI0038057460